MKIPRNIMLCSLWLLASCAGAWALLKYENTPTGIAAAPAEWPTESQIQRQPGRLVLLMFAHPRCPCTRASIGELNRLMTQCQGRADVHVCFIQPKDMSLEWTDTSLRKSATAIPGVHVQLDPDGEEARRFGAESSGFLAVYSPEGKLLFSGGITGGRGHAGDNAGENVVIALLNGQVAQLKHTDVFGCSLYNNECLAPSK